MIHSIWFNFKYHVFLACFSSSEIKVISTLYADIFYHPKPDSDQSVSLDTCTYYSISALLTVKKILVCSIHFC